MHDGGAETTHQPGADAVLRVRHQVEDVLNHREAGADGESGNDRVELVADPVETEEQDHDQHLDDFFDPRRHEAAVDGEADRQPVEEYAAHGISGGGANPSEDEQQQDLAQPHQLECVEPDEDGEKDQNRDEGEPPMRGFGQQLRHLT